MWYFDNQQKLVERNGTLHWKLKQRLANYLKRLENLN